MGLHLGSFTAGFVCGVVAAKTANRFKPVLSDLISVGYMVADSLKTAAAISYERMEDMVEEARVKARGGAWYPWKYSSESTGHGNGHCGPSTGTQSGGDNR